MSLFLMYKLQFKGDKIMSIFLELVSSLLIILGAGLSYYFYTKNKLSNKVNEIVNIAEDSDKVANEKMKLAVNELSKIIPTVLKPFITKQALETLIQKAFDQIEVYAQKQLNKK